MHWPMSKSRAQHQPSGYCMGRTAGVAKDVANDGIRMNCRAPGWIATDGPRQYWESLTPAQRAERGVPTKLLSTEEIVGMVVRLANRQVVKWAHRCLVVGRFAAPD